MNGKRINWALRTIGIIAAAAATLAAPVQAKEWKTVTVALEGGYAPWNLTLPGGKLGGFEPELLANVCERIKVQCNMVAQDWDGMIPGLQAGKFDILMDAISITPDREKILLFSRPYAATPATFAVTDTKILPKAAPGAPIVKLTGDANADKPTVDALRKQLKGKTIGIQSGTVYTKFINDSFKDIASIRVYKTSPSAISTSSPGASTHRSTTSRTTRRTTRRRTTRRSCSRARSSAGRSGGRAKGLRSASRMPT